MRKITSIADFSVSQLIDAIIKNWDVINIFGSTKRKQKKYLLSKTPLELLLLYNEIQAVRRSNMGKES
jgi:vacuolar-type H+-ATPase subunit C/Vma6